MKLIKIIQFFFIDFVVQSNKIKMFCLTCHARQRTFIYKMIALQRSVESRFYSESVFFLDCLRGQWIILQSDVTEFDENLVLRCKCCIFGRKNVLVIYERVVRQWLYWAGIKRLNVIAEYSRDRNSEHNNLKNFAWETT